MGDKRNNTGDYNTGNRNTGDYNTGVFISCDFSNGVFCTIEPKIPIFNMQSNITLEEFYKSKWWYAIKSSTFPLAEWVYYTEEEKQLDEDKRNIGGYLKANTYKEACQKWWDGLTDENKEIIKSLPNFDNEIFEEITGIKIVRKIRFYVGGIIDEIVYFNENTTNEEITEEYISWLGDQRGCAIDWEEVK